VLWLLQFLLTTYRKKVPVYRSYEILEVLQDGSTIRRNVVSDLEFAKVTLEALAKHTTNECIAADERTHQIVAQLNIPPTKRMLKRIFQIAYDEEAGLRRAELLRSRGYGVISVLGNEAAKVLLSFIQKYDLFIIGHAAPEECREEMLNWLREKYPEVKILALNSPHQPLPNADCNALASDAESWLLLIAERVAMSVLHAGS